MPNVPVKLTPFNGLISNCVVVSTIVENNRRNIVFFFRPHKFLHTVRRTLSAVFLKQFAFFSTICFHFYECHDIWLYYNISQWFLSFDISNALFGFRILIRNSKICETKQCVAGIFVSVLLNIKDFLLIEIWILFFWFSGAHIGTTASRE